MLGLIVAIRNFIIGLILSWVGISFTAPKDNIPSIPEVPEKTQPSNLFKIR